MSIIFTSITNNINNCFGISDSEDGTKKTDEDNTQDPLCCFEERVNESGSNEVNCCGCWIPYPRQSSNNAFKKPLL